MRVTRRNRGITVQGIGGTYVVLLGFDVSKPRRKNLLGFALHRQDHTEGEQYWLRGFKTFEATEPDPEPGSLISTREHPIQDFNWGDYTAKPNHKYTYTVVPLYGNPKHLTEGPRVKLTIQTMDEDRGTYAVYFNRGVAGSQAYSRKFGNVKPDDIANPKKRQEAYRWLSRGLEEAILRFIGQAKGKRFGLRAAVYEFSHLPVLEAFGKAAKSKADVKIVYDRRKRGPFAATEKAAKKAGIRKLMIPRKTGSAIAHNKFIILLKDGKPMEVWTGSTNFTKGGIFGQSNVGHIIRDKRVAQQFLDYWTRLSKDPESKDLRKENVAATPDPVGPPPKRSITPLFSPRSDLDALQWYAKRMGAATAFVGFTAAFGISSSLADVLLRRKPYLRFIMVESEGSKRRPKQQPGEPPPRSQFEIFQAIRKVRNNKTARGSILRQKNDAVGSELHRWLNEELTGLNTHVKYLHTKYLMIDAPTKDPILISGSANFSKASTKDNDENMVVIRGNTDVTDVFLGEFLRLFDHFYFRDVVERQKASHRRDDPRKTPYLVPDDSWTKPYFDQTTTKFLERRMLRGPDRPLDQ